MPNKIVLPQDALFINRITLRGPEMQLLHEFLCHEGPIDRESLANCFVPIGDENRSGRADTFNATVDALITLGLLRVAEGMDGKIIAGHLAAGETFQSELLLALRKLSGRQVLFMELYGKCIETNSSLLTEQQLLDIARKKVLSEAGWTPEKIRFWRSISAFVGIVLLTNEGVIIAPRPDRLLQWIRKCLPEGEGWVEKIFTEIDRDFAPCLMPNGRGLHPGWSNALQILQEKGDIELSMGSDAPSILTVNLTEPRTWSWIEIKQVKTSSN